MHNRREFYRRYPSLPKTSIVNTRDALMAVSQGLRARGRVRFRLLGVRVNTRAAAALKGALRLYELRPLW